MTDADNSPDDLWLAAARDAAAVAAAFIAERAATRASLVWEAKTATDFVSEVDIGAEERIRSILTTRIPGLRVIGEELGPEGDATRGLVAIVDPLDGTTNFLHGFPAYCVSIAIAMNGVPRVGVVHDVARGGVYWAVAGRGAYFNDQRIHVSANDQPERALIGTGLPFKDMTHADMYLKQLRHLMPIVAGMRRAGSAALDLCDVACGRFEGFWELKLAPWDIAAGLLIVREAGGICTDLDGREAPIAHGPLVVGSTAMHGWLLAQLTLATGGS